MERQDCLVSVIVPVYNIASYIEECIESIKKQTYQKLEIIIVDDGSTDGSSVICGRIAAADQRIKVIYQKNRGVVSARGRGIEGASGKYISFIDGDDWTEKTMIEKMVEQIGQSDLITTTVRKEIEPGKWVDERDRFPEGIYSESTNLHQVLGKMIYNADDEIIQPLTPGLCNKLFLSKIVKEIYKGMDSNITYGEDAVFVYKYILRCHSIVISHESFYHYRYREGSAVHKVNKHMLMDLNRAYLALESDFREHKMRDCLLIQLQKWILNISCRAINDYMGFDPSIAIPEFIADTTGLENKKIILYGAGKAGQAVYAQLQKFGFSIVLWTDKNHSHYQSLHMPVAAPEKIFSSEYDLVYIAVSDETTAGHIKKELEAKGIPRDKLVWKELMRIF